MVRVMASGVFDILHTGHLDYLEQARSYGDELVVVVACDDTVRKQKHEPITNERMRVRLVSSLKPVDRAVLGNKGDMYSIVKDIRPDVIVLGYDNPLSEGSLKEELSKRGMDIDIKRANKSSEDLEATRLIVRKIRERDDL